MKLKEIDTHQKAFDHVAAHIAQQGERSTTFFKGDSAPTCAYRGENGLMCAAGCLISDENYTEGFECRSLGEGGVRRLDADAIWDAIVRSTGLDADAWTLVYSLQAVHDGGGPYTWKHDLWSLAERFGLSMTEVNNLEWKEDPMHPGP